MTDTQTSKSAEATARARAGLEKIAARIDPAATGIGHVARLSGGASQETWSFSIDAPGGRSKWIMRRAPMGVIARSVLSCGLGIEARLIGLAREAGVPAPRVAYELQPADDLGEGFISEHVEGETLARKILRDEEFKPALPKLARQCGAAMAGIHGIDPSKLPVDLREAPAAGEIAAYRRRYEEYMTPKPVYELAFSWLEANIPPVSGHLALVHGDFRHGNFMVGPEGLRAVLDWELAHLGDPMEDLGWICVNSWRYGYTLPVGGFGTREELFEGYEAAGGRKVDRDAVHFWQMLGSLKWGLMCAGMAHAFTTRAEPTLERAAVGRRASEAEIDLMQLLAPRA